MGAASLPSCTPCGRQVRQRCAVRPAATWSSKAGVVEAELAKLGLQLRTLCDSLHAMWGRALLATGMAGAFRRSALATAGPTVIGMITYNLAPEPIGSPAWSILVPPHKHQCHTGSQLGLGS